MQRRRPDPNKPSFDDRITRQKAALEKQLLNLPEGPKREEIETKLKHLTDAAHECLAQLTRAQKS
jgi:hypothetical protein